MKIFTTLFLIGCLSLTNGCVSQMVLAQTKPSKKFDPETKTVVDVPGDPFGYYMLPLSIPADIALAPIQVPFFMIVGASMLIGGMH